MADKGLPFGFKTIEELEASDAAKNNVTPPAETPPANEPIVTDLKNSEPPKDKKEVTEPNKGTETKPPASGGEPTKINWLEEANKHFKTEFKTPEEFGQVFEKAKKVDSEYEPKIQEYTNNEKKYKQQLEELQSSLNPLSYFSSQEAYVAEQLRKQRPDLTPSVLQDVIMEDTSKMSDLDVLTKNLQLVTKNLKGGESGARAVIFKRYGIDSETNMDELDITTQNEILIEANAVRKQWNELKTSVKPPVVMTEEQKAAAREMAAQERLKQITPFRETFSKFDKFTEQIDEDTTFDFNVPEEYKAELPKMFDTFFVDSGLEVNQENLAAMEEIKQALFLRKNFKQIHKLIEGNVETKMKAERDKLLGNENPTNTHTATEEGVGGDEKFSKEYGFGKLFGDK